MPHITVVVVRLANAGVEQSSLENLGGNLRDTRKNPHVIDAGLEQDLPVNCWYITLTVISTMPLEEIYEQFVKTVWRKLHGQKLLGGRVILNQTLDLLV